MNAKPTRRQAATPNRPGARASAAAKSALRGEAVSHEPLLALGRVNWVLMAAGVASAAAGFLLLSRGEITIAPILIVAGYCGLLPLGIVWSGRRPGPGGAGTGANSSAG